MRVKKNKKQAAATAAMAPPPPPPCRINDEQQLLPDEILEEIFLRVNSGYDLARASTTCRTFHRVATGRLFLRRFLSLHPPPIVGFVRSDIVYGLFAAEPPHRSARAARAVAQAGDFTFSFLPGASSPSSRWCTRDCRGGRFLLSREGTAPTALLELMVADPLYRRYVQIPPVPGDLVPRMPACAEMKSEPFFAPSDKEGSEEHPQFRVIYNWLSDYKIVSFFFSSGTGKWCRAASLSFLPTRPIRHPTKFIRHYASGCFFWVLHLEEYMLILDQREMKFSLVKFLHNQQVAIVDGTEDRLGMLSLGACTLNLHSRGWQNNGAEDEKWRRENSVTLPEPDFWYSIIGAAEGYMILDGSLTILAKERQFFVVDLKTLLIERLCALNFDKWYNYDNYDAHPYASFPPPFSLPSLCEMDSSRDSAPSLG